MSQHKKIPQNVHARQLSLKIHSCFAWGFFSKIKAFYTGKILLKRVTFTNNFFKRQTFVKMQLNKEDVSIGLLKLQLFFSIYYVTWN